jgi:hypothetical protein
MTNQGLQFYVEGNSSQFESLDRGDVFDIKLSCYETLSVKMGDESQKDVDTPIVLNLRKERVGDDQAWRRHDCERFQGPMVRRLWTSEQSANGILHPAGRFSSVLLYMKENVLTRRPLLP